MNWEDSIEIFNQAIKKTGSSTYMWLSVEYLYRRNELGVQQYAFKGRIWLGTSTGASNAGYYNDKVRVNFKFNDEAYFKVYEKGTTSGNWNKTFETDWISLENSQVDENYLSVQVRNTTNNTTIYEEEYFADLNITNETSVLLINDDDKFEITLGQNSSSIQLFIEGLHKNDYNVISFYYDSSSYIRDEPWKEFAGVLDGDYIYLTTQDVINLVNLMVEDGTFKSSFNYDTKVLYYYPKTLRTYTDSTRTQSYGARRIIFWEDAAFDVIIHGLEPTITSSIFNDTNVKSRTLTGNTTTNSTKYLDGSTTIDVSYTIDLKYGATISEAKIGGVNANINGNVVSLNNVKSTNLDLYLVDNRGFELTYTKRLTPMNYIALSYVGNSHRNSPVDNRLKIELQGNFDQLIDNRISNTLSIRYRAYKTGQQGNLPSFTNIPSSSITISNDKYVCDYVTPNTDDPTSIYYYDYNYNYTLEVEIEDVATILTASKKIPKGTPIFYWTENDFHITNKLVIGNSEITNVDNVLDSTSENPVQNKVINTALGNKQDALTPTLITASATKASGSSVVDEVKYALYGGVCCVYVNYHTTSAVSAGTNIWTGYLKVPKPIMKSCMGVGYYASAIQTCELQGTGGGGTSTDNFHIRAAAVQTTSSSQAHILTLTYITDGTMWE